MEMKHLTGVRGMLGWSMQCQHAGSIPPPRSLVVEHIEKIHGNTQSLSCPKIRSDIISVEALL